MDLATKIDVRTPGKTTYFLGAGFSAPAGIPTMAHFVPATLRYLKRYGPQPLLERFATLLNRYRPIASTTGANLDDVQELFSLVSGQSPRGGSHQANEEEVACLRTVICHTLLYAELEDRYHMAMRRRPAAPETPPGDIFEHIKLKLKESAEHDKRLDNLRRPRRAVPQRHAFAVNGKKNGLLRPAGYPPDLNCCLYEAFLSYVLQTSAKRDKKKALVDAIITTNYDMMLERGLEPFSKHYRYDHGDNLDHPQPLQAGKIGVSVVKLHGSLNWHAKRLAAGKIWCERETNEMITQLAKHDLKEILRVFGSVPLIPPTWENRSGDAMKGEVEAFNALRNLALHHLRTAERLVIIGYSMPPTDMHIRYLMTHALNTPDIPMIEIWDVQPKEKMMPAMTTLFGERIARNIHYHPTDTDLGPDKGLAAFVMSHSNQNAFSESV